MTPEIHLSGSSKQIGQGLGESLRNEIQSFLSADFAYINVGREVAFSREEALSAAERYQIILQRWLPELFDEVLGLAEGAQIDWREALLLQYRREIMNEERIEGGCTLVGNKTTIDPFIAQTIDLPPYMMPLGTVVRIEGSFQGKPSILMYSFAGLLGYVGINSAGLAVGMNFLSSKDWQIGISPYLLVRHLLNQSSVDTAHAEIERLPRSSSRCLTLCDADKLITVEMTPMLSRIIQSESMTHTNHYLHSDLVPFDNMNVFSRNASVLRLNRINKLNIDLNERMNPEAILNALSDHSLYPVGICAHAVNDSLGDETVAALVMEPTRQMIHLRKGYPCKQKTRIYAL